MKTKTKTLFLSALLGSSLLLSTVPASAHDDYRYRAERWDYRNGNRDRGGAYRELQEARERLNYDASHHKSRKQIAKDEQNVRNLENQLGSSGWNWRRGWN